MTPKVKYYILEVKTNKKVLSWSVGWDGLAKNVSTTSGTHYLRFSCIRDVSGVVERLNESVKKSRAYIVQEETNETV